MGIPTLVVGQKLKHEFLKSRGQLMKRTSITEANSKVLSEWTLPKMLDIAREEEKQEAEMQSQMKRLLK